MTDELTDRERAVLDIAQRQYRYDASRDQAARDELGISAPQFSQILNALLDRPAAMAYAPNYVKRMRRRREETHSRTARFAADLRR